MAPRSSVTLEMRSLVLLDPARAAPDMCSPISRKKNGKSWQKLWGKLWKKRSSDYPSAPINLPTKVTATFFAFNS